jgi:hypothetical protein
VFPAPVAFCGDMFDQDVVADTTSIIQNIDFWAKIYAA